MKIRLGFAAALAVILTASAAPAAFANNPCGPLWVDDNGNPVKAYQGHINPKNGKDCLITNGNLSEFGGNVNDAITQNWNYIWGNRGTYTDKAGKVSYSPGIGEVDGADNPRMSAWGNGSTIKTDGQGYAIDGKGNRLTYKDANGNTGYVRPSGTDGTKLSPIVYDANGKAIGGLSGDAAAALQKQASLNPPGKGSNMKTVVDKINGNSDAIDTNSRAIGDNANGIADNKKQIGQNAGDIQKLQTGGANDSTARADAKAAIDLMNGVSGPGGGDDVVARRHAAANEVKINQNTGDIAKNRTDIDRNTQGVAQNKADIATNSGRIDETQQSIGDSGFRQESVQNHLSDLNQSLNQTITDTSRADRAYTDQTAVNTLNKANAYTDSRYNQLNGRMNKLRSRVDNGVAGATAIASIPFSNLTKNSFGGSVGVAKDKVAGAVGYQRNFDKHWSARGTVAVGDNYVQGGVGGSFNW